MSISVQEKNRNSQEVSSLSGRKAPNLRGVIESAIETVWGAFRGNGPLKREAADWTQHSSLTYRILDCSNSVGSSDSRQCSSGSDVSDPDWEGMGFPEGEARSAFMTDQEQYLQHEHGFTMGVSLGEGSTATVREAFNRDGRAVVVKSILPDLDDTYTLIVSDERGEGLARRVPKHPHLMQTYGYVISDQQTQKLSYHQNPPQGSMIVGIVSELVPNSQELFEHIQRCRRMSRAQLKKSSQQIIGALAALHQKGMLHRDVKLENVLIDKKGDIKVIDFGYARQLQNIQQGRTQTVCGTYTYMSPEILAGKTYGQKAEAWALGILLFEMATGIVSPFDPEATGELFQTAQNIQKFAQSGKSFSLYMREVYGNRIPHLSPSFWNLLDGLVQPDESKRMTVTEVNQHKFVTN